MRSARTGWSTRSGAGPHRDAIPLDGALRRGRRQAARRATVPDSVPTAERGDDHGDDDRGVVAVQRGGRPAADASGSEHVVTSSRRSLAVVTRVSREASAAGVRRADGYHAAIVVA